MSSNSQFQLLRQEVKGLRDKVRELENLILQLGGSSAAAALNSLQEQQHLAKITVANPDSTVDELKQALPMVQDVAYKEMALQAIRDAELQAELEAGQQEILAGVWDNPRVQNWRRQYEMNKQLDALQRQSF